MVMDVGERGGPENNSRSQFVLQEVKMDGKGTLMAVSSNTGGRRMGKRS